MPVTAGDGSLVGGTARLDQRSESIVGDVLIGHPGMRPPIRQTVLAVARDRRENLVDLDDGALAVGHEEALLKRVDQCGAKRISVGEVFRACALHFVTLCAIGESAGDDVERGEGLKQEVQCCRIIVVRRPRKVCDQPEVVFDDLEHAELVLQGEPPQFVTGGEVRLVAHQQVGVQRVGVAVVEAGAVHHVIRHRHVRSSASSGPVDGSAAPAPPRGRAEATHRSCALSTVLLTGAADFVSQQPFSLLDATLQVADRVPLRRVWADGHQVSVISDDSPVTMTPAPGIPEAAAVG